MRRSRASGESIMTAHLVFPAISRTPAGGDRGVMMALTGHLSSAILHVTVAVVLLPCPPKALIGGGAHGAHPERLGSAQPPPGVSDNAYGLFLAEAGIGT